MKVTYTISDREKVVLELPSLEGLRDVYYIPYELIYISNIIVDGKEVSNRPQYFKAYYIKDENGKPSPHFSYRSKTSGELISRALIDFDYLPVDEFIENPPKEETNYIRQLLFTLFKDDCAGFMVKVGEEEVLYVPYADGKHRWEHNDITLIPAYIKDRRKHSRIKEEFWRLCADVKNNNGIRLVNKDEYDVLFEATFHVSEDCKIVVPMTPDILNNERKKEVEAELFSSACDKPKEVFLKTKFLAGDLYFSYNRQLIPFEDFDYLTINELKKKQDIDYPIDSNELIASLIKNKKNIRLSYEEDEERKLYSVSSIGLGGETITIEGEGKDTKTVLTEDLLSDIKDKKVLIEDINEYSDLHKPKEKAKQ